MTEPQMTSWGKGRLLISLSDKEKYPVQEFMVFVQAARRYIEITQEQPFERKRVPGEVLFEADRLECQLFSGDDPFFEGDEPPRL